MKNNANKFFNRATNSRRYLIKLNKSNRSKLIKAKLKELKINELKLNESNQKNQIKMTQIKIALKLKLLEPFKIILD